MKRVRFTTDAARDFKRHGNVAGRLRRAIAEFAETGAHANNVTKLVGSTGCRMRVGDYRLIVEDGEEEIVVTKVGPRGGIYD